MGVYGNASELSAPCLGLLAPDWNGTHILGLAKSHFHYERAAMISKIERVPLKEVFPHEAYDLTPWLQKNIEVLNDAIDLNLSNPEREQSAGPFSVDIVAEDGAGKFVIIENQLNKSDHDHLGKLITYLVAIDAKTAIWIVADPRPEHIASVSWLNKTSLADFYLLKLETIKIDDSSPAPLLTVIVEPSEGSKAVGKVIIDITERHKIRKQFWSMLLETAKKKTKLHANITPGRDSWIGAGAGKGGLGFNYIITKHESRIELYISRGNEKENKDLFSQLYNKKSDIEQEMTIPLEWESKEGKKTCKIYVEMNKGGYRDEESKWPEIQAEMIETMIRFERALKPHIAKLKI